jgi:tryptophanyl-tRNA synthetase
MDGMTIDPQSGNRKRLLTGDRPTGALHLGHWVGSLENRLRLQEQYRCFFLIADLHALTTHYDRSELLRRNTEELVLDYLSVGIDPQRAVIYLQSLIPEVTELFALFSMLVSVPRLQRVPTLKDTLQTMQTDTVSLGLLSYPVLQSADILMVRADLVPVGEDQAAHIEVTREVARRFNRLYGSVFPVPEALVGQVPTLPGIDGRRKMSKSLGNAIYLSDNAGTVERKVMQMFTDPTRLHPTDPGHVEGNPVFIYHEAFNEDVEEVEELKTRYRAGRVGDVEVKKRLVKALNTFLEPIRDRRQRYACRPHLVREIIADGSRVARTEAQETLALAKEAVGLHTLRGRSCPF